MVRRQKTLVAFVVAATAVTLMNAVPAGARTPAASAAPTVGTPYDQGDHPSRAQDNRRGTAAPPDRHRAAAAPVADPVAAARRYLTANQDLYGLDAGAVAAMDTVLVEPLGAGTVVQLQQRFGALPAGHDGLVSLLLAGDRVLRVTSSLSRDT